MQIFCSFPRLLVVIFLVELFDVFVVVVVVFFFTCVYLEQFLEDVNLRYIVISKLLIASQEYEYRR